MSMPLNLSFFGGIVIVIFTGTEVIALVSDIVIRES